MNLFKKILTYAIIIGIFGGFITYTTKKINRLTADNERLSNNMLNSNFEVQVREAKNKELVYSVNTLTVKANELKQINSRLYGDIRDLKLEIKRIQALTEIKSTLEQTIDTIQTVPYIDLHTAEVSFKFNFNDKFTAIDGEVVIPEKYTFNKVKEFLPTLSENEILDLVDTDIKNKIISSNIDSPYINKLHYIIQDNLLVIPEFQYKRHWIFWKKVTGVKVHVKSSNPNYKVDTIQSYQITK